MNLPRNLPRNLQTGLAVGVLLFSGCQAGQTRASSADYKHPLKEGTRICGRPDFSAMFPYSIRSATLPILVHYYRESEAETARKTLAFAEKGWDFHVNRIGMRPVPPDGGDCGPDDAFDIFVWKGHRSCEVFDISEVPSTSWDDRRVYMAVDPWGPYGGAELEETVVHEMAHASQAADDWFESPILLEMSALFLDQVYADRYIKTYLNDFQQHPDWSLERDDKYVTWYMYGSSLYLLYLSERFFDGDARFISRIWLESRSAPGAQQEQKKNEPDYVDALDRMLREKANVSYEDSIVEFSRWRWYTGDHLDGHHFTRLHSGQENLRAAKLTLAARRQLRVGKVEKIHIGKSAPMVHGSSYIELTAASAAAAPVSIALEAPSDARRRFVVQAVPGLSDDSDGEVLDLATGPKPLRFSASGTRTVIVTVLPTGPYDPDLREDTRHPFTLIAAP